MMLISIISAFQQLPDGLPEFVHNPVLILAVPYFEKALEVSPNNDLVLIFLVDLYVNYLSDNLYSEYLKAYIWYSKNQNLHQLKDLLMATFEKDKSRLDIVQQVAKAYYYLGDYHTSSIDYKKFTELREAYNLDIYNSENAKRAYVFDQVGEKELSEKYIEKFKSD